MVLNLFRSSAENEDPTELSSPRPHGVKSVTHGSQSFWQWLVGYNDTEANRLGVPTVSVSDWVRGIRQRDDVSVLAYLDSLFPFTKWIGSYNLQWLIGDLIAGITVGLVVVPQSMSYALIADLKAQYGLYSAFIGVWIYVFFATSKDVTIGPVAVMSLQTANVITQVQAKFPHRYTNPEIASALAFICGVITLGIGLLRIGWLVEFIPAPAVAGFMTGSAFTIAVGQVPKLMGISGITTNGPPSYQIVIDTLKGLPRTKIDAAFGLTALFFLYAIRSLCVHLPRRYPKLARVCFFVSVFRSAFVIIILTIASRLWVPHFKKAPISILGTVPRGFQNVGSPYLSKQIFSDMASEIPVSVIVLLLEHIAIAKSFGRINNYKINPNQELIAIGVTNLIGPAFGGYAATGSFSRSAIKAKSGVRTPLAGWVTGIIVLIAIYALTGTFYWIPSAALSAVIIHAVGDLMCSPRVVYKFWQVSPLEMLIFLAAVFASVFKTLEVGVYVSVALSAALLLIRIAHPRGRWLGVVRVHQGSSPTSTVTGEHRDVFVPLDDKDGLRDPSIRVQAPPPGVFVYRFEEAFTYPNASQLSDRIVDYVKVHTRPGRPANSMKLGDRPWNNPGPVNPLLAKAVRPFTFGKAKRNLNDKIILATEPETIADSRPLLRALVLDFSGVSNVDTTSIQNLVDVRTGLERYTDAPVEFHFANILSPWIRRALLAGGFGTNATRGSITEVAPLVPSRVGAPKQEETPLKNINEYAVRSSQAAQAQADGDDRINLDESSANPSNYALLKQGSGADNSSSTSLSDSKDRSDVEGSAQRRGHGNAETLSDSEDVPILWNQDLTPCFHLDLSDALAAATRAAQAWEVVTPGQDAPQWKN